MMRSLTAVGASLCVLLAASASQAQQRRGEFGQQGQFILSADRLVPLFSYSHSSFDEAANPPVTKSTTSTSQSGLSFLYGSTLYGSTLDTKDVFFTVPRVGFDYVIVPNLTIGGDVVVFLTLGGSTSQEVDTANITRTASQDSPSTTVFGIAPRVGYILGLSDLFSLWLRGGLSFYTLSRKQTLNNNNPNTTHTDSIHQFALDLEPQLVITPIPHLGFTAGITADIPFAGGHSTEDDTSNTSNTFSASSSIFYLGLTVGMLGYF